MTTQKVPRTDRDCWPFPCRAFHNTWTFLEGGELCDCRCHAEKPARKPRESETELRAAWGDR